MAYTVPTYATFIARFPVFATQDETLIETLITEAQRVVDTTWLEADYTTAINYLVAHWLETDPAVGGDASGGTGEIASESFGPISVSYQKQTSSLSNSPLATTEFGRRFLEIRRGNFPAMLAV